MMRAVWQTLDVGISLLLGSLDDVEALVMCERLLETLVRMSKEREDSTGIKAAIEKIERERKDRGRLPIPSANGWYEYYSLVIEDEVLEELDRAKAGMSQGKLYIQWAKELVGCLPSIVDRSARLEFHPFAAIGEHIPLAHRTLFEQAHMLYLFDFDIPCIFTCGTLVEEVVNKAFPELYEKWSLKQSLERKMVPWKAKMGDVVSHNPKFKAAEKLFLDIMYTRNEVAHNPAAYLKAGGSMSETILRKTRQALKILFEVAKSQPD